jgi:murein DD-endopeptidase MepM/ murein hydrolase activator NlpD
MNHSKELRRPLKFSMKGKIVSSVLLLAIILTAIPAQFSSASTSQDLQKKIEETKRERELLIQEEQRLKAELDAITRQGQSLKSTVQTLAAAKQKLANDIKLTSSKISSTNLNIQTLENSLNDKGRKIQAHKTAIKSALQELANAGTRSLALDFLSSKQLSDVWGDRARLEDLNTRLNSEVGELMETKEVLGQEILLKEKNKKQLESLQNQLGGQKKVVEASQTAQATLLAQTKSKEAEYQKLLADNLMRQKEFEDELFKFESELKISLDPSLLPSARAGVLSWPLDNVIVTQRFGKTSSSGRLYASGTHNGVDFRASMGTPVKAVLAGVVQGTGNTDEQKGCYSYGRWVLIKHPNGISSVYAHLSGSIVRQGQTVDTGEIIGYSGGMPGVFGSGYSTGPHLHLGLFASQGVSVQQFTSSRGCKQVFVPIADSQAYLDPLAYLPSAN